MYLISCIYLYIVTTNTNIHLYMNIQASVYMFKMYMTYILYGHSQQGMCCMITDKSRTVSLFYYFETYLFAVHLL